MTEACLRTAKGGWLEPAVRVPEMWYEQGSLI